MDNFQFDDDFNDQDDLDNSEREEDSFFSPEELSDLLGEQRKIDDAKHIYEKITGFIEEKENKIIKAEDLKDNISDFELEKILQYDEEDRKKDFYVPADESTTVDRTNEELFNDYLKYPKITGRKSIQDDSTLIPQEILDETKKIIEIKDEEPDQDGHHTSIEIIRDQFEEIESIVVYCKCGEKTVIHFDYDTDEKIEDKITTKTKVNPFSVEEIKLKISDNED